MSKRYLLTPSGRVPLAQSRSIAGEDVRPRGNPYVGMSSTARSDAEWISVEQEWGGARSGMHRSFSSGMPTTAPVALQYDFGKRASWHSVKSPWTDMSQGINDAAITSFLASIPADHELFFTYFHEPENDFPLGEEESRSAKWRAAQVHFYDLVKSIRPQTLVGPILMGWTFNPSSGRAASRWIPPADKMDFFGLDPYNPYKLPSMGDTNNWKEFQSPELVAWQNVCDAMGVPGAIAETGCAEDESGIGPTRKSQWLTRAFDYSLAHNHLAFCYFNVAKQDDTPESILLNSSPEALSVWADILARYQKGVV